MAMAAPYRELPAPLCPLMRLSSRFCIPFRQCIGGEAVVCETGEVVVCVSMLSSDAESILQELSSWGDFKSGVR